MKQIYNIIITEVSSINSNIILQIIIKIINYSMKSYKSIFILFVFNVYFCMNYKNTSIISIIKRIIIMRKIINKIKKFVFECQMRDALNIRNKFSTTIHNFYLNFFVLV